MKRYTYSEARRRLADVLDTARTEEVLITRRSGDAFRIVYETPRSSPLDVPFIKTRATTKDIVDAVRESRRRSG